MRRRIVLYDPEALLDTELPLDRELHTSLVAVVLAWTDPGDALPPGDCEQIALQLSGHARLLAAEVGRRCEPLATDSSMRALVEVVLSEAHGRLSTPVRGTVGCVQNRARLVRALYERLDRLEAESPAFSDP